MDSKLCRLEYSRHRAIAILFVNNYFQSRSHRRYIESIITYMEDNQYIIIEPTRGGSKHYIGFDKRLGWVVVKRVTYDQHLLENAKQVIGLHSLPSASANTILFCTCYVKEGQTDYGYIVSELCEESVTDRLSRVNVPDELKFQYVKEMWDGLEYLHSKKKTIHRDVKPDNLLISLSGTLKIADFGVARQLKSNSTRVAGSPAWQPVRLIGETNHVINERDDLYSAALCAFYIFSGGEHPFRSEQDDENGLSNKDYKEKIQNLIFRHELDNPNLQCCFREIFDDLNKEVLYDAPTLREKIVTAWNAKRQVSTPGQRFAILLSNNSLPSSAADVTFINNALQDCRYDVTIIGNSSPKKLNIALQNVADKINAGDVNEDCHVWLHSTTHGFSVEDDTFLLLGDDKWVSLKEIIRATYQNITIKPKVKSVFTIDACRKVEDPKKFNIFSPWENLIPLDHINYAVFYSCEKDNVAIDGNVFYIPSPFSKTLALNIKRQERLVETFENVQRIVVEKGYMKPDLEGNISEFIF